MKYRFMVTLSLLFGALSSASLNAETLRRAIDDEPSSLDPQLAQGMPEMHILRDMFVGLVDEAADASLVAGVAERWEIADEGFTYRFYLRDSKWSDGSPVSADDFVYAWRRAVDPAFGSKYAFFLYPVKNAQAINEGKLPVDQLGIVAKDDKTLVVTLEHPTPYFLDMLVNAVAYPVPKKTVEQHGAAWTRPENIVVNGAYHLKDWQPQGFLRLEKSPLYYGADSVRLDEVIYYPTPDQSAALKRYRAGELDLTSDVPNEQMPWIRAHLKDELKINPYLGVFYFGFNLTKAPFKDNPKLRAALSLAVEREPIVEHITAGGEKPAFHFVVPQIQGYTPYIPADAQLSREQRLEKARALYAEAGYSKENPLKIELLYNTNEVNKKISVAIAAMWQSALGVQTQLVNKEWKTYLIDRRNYDTQVFRGTWVGDYNDANTFLDLFVSGGGSNTVGLADKEFDKLIAQAAGEQDQTARAALLQQAERRLLDNYSLIPIYFFVSKHMVKPYVRGYQENVMDHWHSKYLWIER